MRAASLLVATTLIVSAVVVSTTGCATTDRARSTTSIQSRTKTEKQLQPFASERELRRFFRTFAEEQKRAREKLAEAVREAASAALLSDGAVAASEVPI